MRDFIKILALFSTKLMQLIICMRPYGANCKMKS